MSDLLSNKVCEKKSAKSYHSKACLLLT